jgi:hypothetical protein
MKSPKCFIHGTTFNPHVSWKQTRAVVNALKKDTTAVAMAVNDGPALKAFQYRCCNGKKGTEIAKRCRRSDFG